MWILALLVALSWSQAPTPWKQPPSEVIEVLHAPPLPSVWSSPGATHLVLASAVRYPPLAELAADRVPLAGIRVNARTNGPHGSTGYTDVSILRVSDGERTPIALPEGARMLGVRWTADGEGLALTLLFDDHIGLWVGRADGTGQEIEGLALNPLLGAYASWLPDQKRLLVKQIPPREAAPEAPLVPAGPIVRAGDGDRATSTYEARDVLGSAHDEALFEYYTTSQLAVVDPRKGTVTPLGNPDLYANVSASPNGRLLLVERMKGPWSHRHAWWRFGSEVEVWKMNGVKTHTVASLPLADAVPIHGVAEGARNVSWRPTAPATLMWIEALDGGDPVAKVDHRDRLFTHAAPFKGDPTPVFDAAHRVRGWWWGEADGTLMLQQYERARRWRHVWLLDVDQGTSRPLFDLSSNDRYADPGSPVMTTLENGRRVMEQVGGDVFFRGRGSSPDGDRPFLDRRSLETGEVERLYRSDPDRYERFVAFIDAEAGEFLTRRESPTDPPNTWRTTLGATVAADEGEAQRERSDVALTHFEDPVPQLRQIEKRIVRYERDDDHDARFENRGTLDAQGAIALDERDTTGDGRFDLRQHFTAGTKTKEERDTRGDGRYDVVTFFEQGVRVRQKMDTRGDHRTDSVLYFEDDRQVRQERDTNGDGRFDLHVALDESERPAREDFDTNFDDQVDVVRLYVDGQITREERDRDFDGRFELANRYEAGVLVESTAHDGDLTGPWTVRVEYAEGQRRRQFEDRNRDGQADLSSFFSRDGNALERIEEDADFDGRAETVRHYAGGTLSRTETDADGDGVVELTAYFEDDVAARIEIRSAERDCVETRQWLSSEGEVTAEEKDTDADCRYDTWNYYTAGRLKRQGRDTEGRGRAHLLYEFNADGSVRSQELVSETKAKRPDKKAFYTKAGDVHRQCTDRDGDGDFDIDLRFEGGQATFALIDSANSGRADRREIYQAGALARVEADTNADGRPDIVQVYDGASVAVQQEDTDHDGVFDVRFEDGAAVETEAPEPAPAPIPPLECGRFSSFWG